MTFHLSRNDFLRRVEARRGTRTVTEVLPLSRRGGCLWSERDSPCKSVEGAATEERGRRNTTTDAYTAPSRFKFSFFSRIFSPPPTFGTFRAFLLSLVGNEKVRDATRSRNEIDARLRVRGEGVVGGQDRIFAVCEEREKELRVANEKAGER